MTGLRVETWIGWTRGGLGGSPASDVGGSIASPQGTQHTVSSRAGMSRLAAEPKGEGRAEHGIIITDEREESEKIG